MNGRHVDWKITLCPKSLRAYHYTRWWNATRPKMPRFRTRALHREVISFIFFLPFFPFFSPPFFPFFRDCTGVKKWGALVGGWLFESSRRDEWRPRSPFTRAPDSRTLGIVRIDPGMPRDLFLSRLVLGASYRCTARASSRIKSAGDFFRSDVRTSRDAPRSRSRLRSTLCQILCAPRVTEWSKKAQKNSKKKTRFPLLLRIQYLSAINSFTDWLSISRHGKRRDVDNFASAK